MIRSCRIAAIAAIILIAAGDFRPVSGASNVHVSSHRADTDRDHWWDRSTTLHAAPYRIRTDLPREEADLYARQLQRIHAAFRSAFGQLPRRTTGDHAILLFQTHADYLNTLQSPFGINAVGTGGMYFHRSEGSAVAVWISDRPRQHILHVLQHEAFHQFARTHFGTDLPPWVDEGLAEYFGTALITDERIITGQIRPSLLKSIQNAIEQDGHVPFRELFRMSHDEWWNELRRGRGPLVYHQAWSMVHFLLHGENGRHRGTFERYLRLVADGVSANRAFQRAFEMDDPDAFERAWRAHVVAAEPSAFVTALERIDFLAAGALALSKRGSRPMTLESLQRELEAIDFQRSMSIHGIAVTLSASDEDAFTIPSRDDARSKPRFVVSEPKRRILPRRMQQLVRDNPPPATIATEHLEPHNLIVQWIRDFDTNTLRYEIEFK